MRFASIVEASTLAAATRSRLAKRDAIAACLRLAGGDEVAMAVAFLAGEIRQGRIGIGPATLRALRGSAAAESVLSVAEVDAVFDRIVATTGKGSAGLRATQLGQLFARALPAEQDFLVRLLLGELRQGALEGVMIEAIAAASGMAAAAVRRAVMFSGDLGLVAQTAAIGGATGLAPFSIELMRPVQPMLAQPAEDIADALGRLGTAALEWKLDGARVQVHKSGGEVRVFTRNLNDVTVAVPEIVEIVGALDADRLIIDGEAIALTAGGAPQPFQVTMRR
ncbi:MAG: ATP-dependent DNA ligase, partial [Betaproteobacteria bacterium]